MSDFLGSQRELSVEASGGTEVVLKTGEKIEFDHSSIVRLKRPDKLRTDRRGEKADLTFYYDGRTFTLFGKQTDYYATYAAPGNIDQAIDAARDKLGIEAPAADLLYSKPYNVLMEDVVSGRYLGTATVNGQPCHHLAFRGHETDWQIWIQQGATPVPLKFVIASKKVDKVPEFTVEMTNWNFAPNLSDAEFEFTPPADAKRIEFLPEMLGRQGAKGGQR